MQKNGNRSLTPATVRKLREKFARPAKYGTREDRIAAEAVKLGVAPGTIRNAIAGRTYKHAEGPITRRERSQAVAA